MYFLSNNGSLIYTSTFLYKNLYLSLYISSNIRTTSDFHSKMKVRSLLIYFHIIILTLNISKFTSYSPNLKTPFHCHPNIKYNCQFAKIALRQFFISTTGRKYRTFVLKHIDNAEYMFYTYQQ